MPPSADRGQVCQASSVSPHTHRYIHSSLYSHGSIVHWPTVSITNTIPQVNCAIHFSLLHYCSSSWNWLIQEQTRSMHQYSQQDCYSWISTYSTVDCTSMSQSDCWYFMHFLYLLTRFGNQACQWVVAGSIPRPSGWIGGRKVKEWSLPLHRYQSWYSRTKLWFGLHLHVCLSLLQTALAVLYSTWMMVNSSCM